MTTSDRSLRSREHRRARRTRPAAPRRATAAPQPAGAQPAVRPPLPATPQDTDKLRPQYIVLPEGIAPPLDSSFGGRVRLKKDDETPSVELPCERMAFIYQRLSTTEQKKNSRYSLERQDDLERIAIENGYRSVLTREQVDALRKEADYPGHYINGQIIVEGRDLGVSGTKGQEERAGLAHLIELIEADRVESVYVVEISRISRDQTLITGLQFGELCREHNVIIVTPSMRLNLRDEMHMRMYRYEIDRAAEELKSIRSRMHGAKVMKARHGYHVGNSIPSGFVIDREEHLPDGSLNPYYQKYKIFEPHAKVVHTIFRMLAEPGAYLRGVALECRRRGITFSRLPDDLQAIKSNAASFARTKPNPDGSYPITVGRLESIVSNPAYIGWFIWAGEVISKDNHPAIIDEETFWAVQKKRGRKGFRQNEIHETLPLAGLLYCANHPSPRRITSGNARDRDRAQYHCRNEDAEGHCLHIAAYILEEPTAEFIVQQCSFTGYADEILRRLTDEHAEAKERVAANKREFQRIVGEIENLKANLSRTRTPEQVDLMLGLIDEKMKEKERLTAMDSQPIGRVLSEAEVRTVHEFLANLKSGWPDMTDTAKNTFLSLLLERIDIQHNASFITARIMWRTGLQQAIRIERPFVDNRKEWTKDEDDLVRAHYASMPIKRLCALLPGRTWKAIRLRGRILGINRIAKADLTRSNPRPYTEAEDQVIRDFYAFNITREEMHARLGHHTEDSIYCRAAKLGFRRRKRFVKWTVVDTGRGGEEGKNGDSGGNLKVVTNESCCRAAAA